MKDSKSLVVFYSLDGNTQFISEEIKKGTNADLLKLQPEKNNVNSKGFMKYVWGGRQVMMGKKPELLPFDVDFNSYDVIFIGTPIWASRHAPAIHTFLSNHLLRNKKIALFCCHSGGGNGKAFNKMKEQLTGNTIVGEIEFKEPIKKGKDEAKKELMDWLNEIEMVRK